MCSLLMLLSYIPFPCCFVFLVLSVDAIDMSGKHEVDLHTNIWKVKLLFHLIWQLFSQLNFSNIIVYPDPQLASCMYACLADWVVSYLHSPFTQNVVIYNLISCLVIISKFMFHLFFRFLTYIWHIWLSFDLPCSST